MILFSTMMILMLVALLVLSQLQMNLMYYQAHRQWVHVHQRFRQMENQAISLASKVSTVQDSDCLRHGDNPNTVIKALRHQQGCSLVINNEYYLYLIEDLGILECMQSVFNNKLYSTQHRRITLGAVDDNGPVLQLRFARLVKLMPCESGTITYIQPGMLSWRYLSSPLAEG